MRKLKGKKKKKKKVQLLNNYHFCIERKEKGRDDDIDAESVMRLMGGSE